MCRDCCRVEKSPKAAVPALVLFLGWGLLILEAPAGWGLVGGENPSLTTPKGCIESTCLNVLALDFLYSSHSSGAFTRKSSKDATHLVDVEWNAPGGVTARTSLKRSARSLRGDSTSTFIISDVAHEMSLGIGAGTRLTARWDWERSRREHSRRIVSKGEDQTAVELTTELGGDVEALRLAVVSREQFDEESRTDESRCEAHLKVAPFPALKLKTDYAVTRPSDGCERTSHAIAATLISGKGGGCTATLKRRSDGQGEARQVGGIASTRG